MQQLRVRVSVQLLKITVFYNPNITGDRVQKRVAEQASDFGTDTVYPIQLVEGTYDPQRFYEITKGMEQMDEGGERCFACYRLRLEEAAKLADGCLTMLQRHFP